MCVHMNMQYVMCMESCYQPDFMTSLCYTPTYITHVFVDVHYLSQSPGDAPLLDIDLEWDLPDFATIGICNTSTVTLAVHMHQGLNEYCMNRPTGIKTHACILCRAYGSIWCLEWWFTCVCISLITWARSGERAQV